MFSDETTALADPPVGSATMLESAPSCPLTQEAAAPPVWLNRGKIPSLDGLRCVAILGILAYHARTSIGFPAGQWLHYFSRQGFLGVDLFFVISAFLITTLLVRELERQETLNLKRFYLRRCLRILPAYVAYLVVIAICQRAEMIELKAVDWFGALTFTTNFFANRTGCELSHAWSLSVEEHFYLIWPIVLGAGGLRGGWRFGISCLLACWVVRVAIVLGLPELFFASDPEWADHASWLRFADLNTFARLDTISMGSMLALASRSRRWRDYLDRLSAPPGMCVCAILLCLSIKLMDVDNYAQLIGYSVNSACMSLLVWGLIRSKGLSHQVLNSPLLINIGVMSYSIYLWQQLFTTRHEGWIYQFPQNVVLTYFAAAVSFRLIERPMNRLKDLLSR